MSFSSSESLSIWKADNGFQARDMEDNAVPVVVKTKSNLPHPAEEEFFRPPRLRRQSSSNVTIPFPDLEVENPSGEIRGPGQQVIHRRRHDRRQWDSRRPHMMQSTISWSFRAPYEQKTPSETPRAPDDPITQRMDVHADWLGREIDKELSIGNYAYCLLDEQICDSTREFFTMFLRLVVVARDLFCRSRFCSRFSSSNAELEEAVNLLLLLDEGFDGYNNHLSSREMDMELADDFVSRNLKETTFEEIDEGLTACHFYLASTPLFCEGELELIDAALACYKRQIYQGRIRKWLSRDADEGCDDAPSVLYFSLLACRYKASKLWLAGDRIYGKILHAINVGAATYPKRSRRSTAGDE
ncbi:MAG: hypothetical protein M1814_005252 [Vezdaea aestivalis]|nr:MAG: hypothetical protein M1814_005252 [Vezdaea aestivalis]